MIPYILFLTNLGFSLVGDNPGTMPLSSKPQALNNPIYSVHNYKRPYTGLVEKSKKGIAVTGLAARPTSYKGQQLAQQTSGSISVVYVPTATSATRNYKQQNQLRSVEVTAKGRQSGDQVAVIQNVPDSLHQNNPK